MHILIDTHILIWWWAEDPQLPMPLRDLISADETTVYVSAISALELGIKVRLGRLPQMVQRLHQFNEGVVEDGFYHLNIHYEHARRAGLLPGEHRDPFDRVLAAQSLYEQMPIVTSDREIAAFGCDVIW
ncbi:type II toxin-antitoxin system VapC family toxin [Sphingomonas sp. PB4P5]|uniref:type II toxin-antitoxin system VapC family toxin n=1 Tax=Parasphingomonas puruogangriensis TaxID=3096155 RepID=UPI002FC6D4F4